MSSQGLAQEQPNNGREHRDEARTSAQSGGECNTVDDIEISSVTTVAASGSGTNQGDGQGIE